MGTKLNPGIYDCYANAEPDEPMFTLLARDRSAKYLVAAWVAIKCGDTDNAVRLMLDAIREQCNAKDGKFAERTDAKMDEASQCAKTMQSWIEMRYLAEIEARLEVKP